MEPRTLGGQLFALKGLAWPFVCIRRKQWSGPPELKDLDKNGDRFRLVGAPDWSRESASYS